jgi:hypothetical protein
VAVANSGARVSRFLLRFSDIGYPCGMAFYRWIGKITVRTTVLFIPDKIFTTQRKEPIMNHPVIMIPYRSHMTMDILIPYLLCCAADILDVA